MYSALCIFIDCLVYCLISLRYSSGSSCQSSYPRRRRDWIAILHYTKMVCIFKTKFFCRVIAFSRPESDTQMVPALNYNGLKHCTSINLFRQIGCKNILKLKCNLFNRKIRNQKGPSSDCWTVDRRYKQLLLFCY